MEPNDQLSEAIEVAAAHAIPSDGGEFVTGDYLGLAEVLLEDGRIGIVILAPELTSSHARLLSRALDQAIGALLESTVVEAVKGSDLDEG